jgi:hypothetical protein
MYILRFQAKIIQSPTKKSTHQALSSPLKCSSLAPTRPPVLTNRLASCTFPACQSFLCPSDEFVCREGSR